ncbi:hypothetical protein BGZ98_009947 [Dissophora globulifera]|nr:hypothetical protein BGZ98_009947 [Dissophora globulifera]
MPGDETTVPTKVSEKVLIGLGAAGGLLVCMLGMIALCRHRRKKNLAEALLRQTAQFNHNNPYAKLSEPAMGAKDIKSASPTKPIGTYSVIAMYTPALADEIEIHVGDSVTILQEYDDGWCLGMNNSRSGIEGVFPRHCLEGHYGNAGPGYYPPNASFKGMANKRMSSIPAGGWNNVNIGYNGGCGRGHGYGNFRPNPNPVPQYGGYNGRY